MTENKKAVRMPLEMEDKKSTGDNSKTKNDLKIKELAQKKESQTAATSDHLDNAVFSHGPSNRGK